MKEIRQVRRRRNAVDDAEHHAGSAVQIEGVMPTQQARSGATMLALLRAGRQALEQGGLDNMTISEIARSAGTSVGAFYGRFENKEAFFAAVQTMVISEIEVDFDAMFEALERDEVDVVEMLHAISVFWVGLFRSNRGLYQAAFKHASAQPGVWTPFKRLGYKASGMIVEHVLPRLRQMGLATEEVQIRMAMQFANGLLINSVINDPGPVKLDDPDMEVHVARFLCTFLGVPVASSAAPVAAPAVRRGRKT